MMGKILFLAGAATGYVLGSKAGRQAYDQIKGKAQDLWGDPNVQKVVSQAGQAAKDAATVAQSKISGAAKDAKNDTSSNSMSTSTDTPVVSTTSTEDGFQEEIPVVPPTTFGAPGTTGTTTPPV
jgi:uncharacterized protein (UPF0333 family)